MMPQPQTPSGCDAAKNDNPLARHGHVSYLEIPALNLQQAANFYEAVFGLQIHHRGPGQVSFDDRSGQLIGRWVSGAAPSRKAGIVPYIYVNGIDGAAARVSDHGGEIVKPPYAEGDVWVATFHDPAGNLLGIWQFGPR